MHCLQKHGHNNLASYPISQLSSQFVSIIRNLQISKIFHRTPIENVKKDEI